MPGGALTRDHGAAAPGGAPDHGAELTPADEALLRGPVPARALAWCEREAGARVVAAEPFRGGTSSAVHALALADGRALVLRRFVRADWLAEEPDAPAREVAALRLAERCAVPTPRLVAADPDGTAAGAPAVLTTRLPGAVVWRPDAVEPFLRGLAALLPAIHATRARAGRSAAVRALRARVPASRRPAHATAASGKRPSRASTPPRRTRRPSSCIATSTPATSSGPATRSPDWSTGRARRSGPRRRTSGHCRWNLARTLGLAAADRFLALTGIAYDPYWDVVAALGGFDAAELAAKPPVEEAFLAAAVSRA